MPEPDAVSNPREIIAEIAANKYSWPIHVLHHESIHAHQFGVGTEGREQYKVWRQLLRFAPTFVNLFIAPGKAKRQILRFHEEDIISETQAYRGASRYSGEEDTTAKMINKLKLYDHTSPEEGDRVMIADQQIRRLYALGLSDEEIGPMIPAAKWDAERFCYSNLEDEVQKHRAARNLDEENLDNLVMVDDYKRKIFLERLQLVAQDELKCTASERNIDIDSVVKK